jgi:hypothetical protein
MPRTRGANRPRREARVRLRQPDIISDAVLNADSLTRQQPGLTGGEAMTEIAARLSAGGIA